MARTHWRTSELLAQGWRPADLISFLSQRPDIRLDGEPAYTVHRVDAALAKSPALRSQIVAHVEPAGEWLHTLAAVAEANGISQTTVKRRLGSPATYRLRKSAQHGFWGGYTSAQIEAARLNVPQNVRYTVSGNTAANLAQVAALRQVSTQPPKKHTPRCFD